MRINFKIQIVLIMIISWSLLIGCKKSYESENYETEYSINNIQIDVKAKGIIKGDNNEPIDFKKFVIDENYGCNFSIGYSDLLEYRFSKPVWIKEISFYLEKINFDNKKGILQLKIEIYPDEKVMPLEAFEFNLEKDNNIYRINFANNNFVNFLKYKSISISIKWKDVGGNARGEEVYIKNLKISLADKETFVASVKFDDIKKKCLSKKDTNGKIKFNNDYFSLNEIRHLVFYAINGNQEAEKYLNDLSPSSAEMGETLSSIHSWYLLNKNNH